MAKYKPQDATTNPSLILAATKKPEYGALLDAAIAEAKKGPGSPEEKVDAALDYLLVQFGKKILEIVPGKVSTEVDAALSFDTKASVDKALHIIKVRFPQHFRLPDSLTWGNTDFFSNSSTRPRASPRTAS